MKKLILLGAFAFSSLCFAETTNNIVESSNNDNALVSQLEQVIDCSQLLIPSFVKDVWWEVSFTNACGQTTTVFFQSSNTDGSQAFIDELAYAVNTGYVDCLL